MAKRLEGIDIKTEQKLAEFVSSCTYDPIRFIKVMFPWGEKGTPLEKVKGLESWQKEFFEYIRDQLVENKKRIDNGEHPLPIQTATASGHGAGKSWVVAMLTLFFMSTSPGLRGVVTATTKEQLENRTWSTLREWHSMILNKHWFGIDKHDIYFNLFDDETMKQTYRITAESVAADRTEAIAGLHNRGKKILIIFDEASGIHDKVWEVIEGAKSDGEVIFCTFGNPTRSEGMFRECFRKNKKFFKTWHVDSRNISFTNKQVLNNIIEMYGADSDVAKVRIYGEFPDQTFDGFIPESLYQKCINAEIVESGLEPLILGLDIAGMGDDTTVLYPRKGNDATLPRIELRRKEPKEIAQVVADWCSRNEPDAIFLENIGPGIAVAEHLKMWGYQLTMVPVGAPSSNKTYLNVRAELWSKMQEWMQAGGKMPDDEEIKKEALTIKYQIGDDNKLRLEKKKDMKARGLNSPDHMDALALTFYAPVRKKDKYSSRNGNFNQYNSDYNLFDY